MAEYNRFAGAELSDKDITARANGRLEDPDLRLQETVKEFNAAVADKLLPTVMRLIPEFVKLLPYVEQSAKRFAQLAEAFAQDPIGGVVKLAAAKLAFDIAASTAADSGKKLASALSGAAGSVGVAGGNLSGAITGAQLGISAAAIIVAASLANFEKGEADMNASGQKLNRLRELTGKARGGEALTAEEQKEARGLQIDLGKAKDKAATPDMLETGLAGGLSVLQKLMALQSFGASTMIDADPNKVAQGLVHPSKGVEAKTQEAFSLEADKLVNELSKLSSAIAKMPVAAGGPGPNRGNGPSPVKG
jgi:hypothetical protein